MIDYIIFFLVFISKIQLKKAGKYENKTNKEEDGPIHLQT